MRHDRDSSEYIKPFANVAVSHQVTPVDHSVTQSVTPVNLSINQKIRQCYGATKFSIIVKNFKYSERSQIKGKGKIFSKVLQSNQ